MSIILSIIAIVVILLVALFIAGTRAKGELKKRYPPQGQLVDMGGYKLHVQVEGRGTPTVVMEAGAGGLGLAWELVRPVIARHTRVVVYDRAGLGWSGPSPRPRHTSVMAEELYTLLQNANIPAPYVMVGHSLGGPVVRQFAARYPGEVVGMVLVDSAHEQQYQRFPQELVKMLDSMKVMFSVMRWLNVFGVHALNPKMVAGDETGPRNILEPYRALVATNPNHFPTVLAETDAAMQGGAAPAPLGDLPLVVLSHGVPQDVPMAKPEANRAYEGVWQAMQAELAALSTRGQRRVVEGAGHNIQLDQPQAVTDAICEVLAQCRATASQPAEVRVDVAQ